MKKFVLGSLVALLATSALAENLINTQTKTWKSIPITVESNTYTTGNSYLMPEGDYYYTYSGYRCLKNADIAGVKPLVLKPRNNKDPLIYCYPAK